MTQPEQPPVSANSNNNDDEPPVVVVPAVPISSEEDDEMVLWQTQVRKAVTPYLPPPVVRTMKHTIDPALHDFMGPEASITLVTSALVGLWVLYVLKWFVASTSSSRKKAIAEDDDTLLSASHKTDQIIQGTVLVCGPSGSGKTTLLYRLLYPEIMPTLKSVTSLSVNVGHLAVNDDDDNGSKTTVMRLVDLPGHYRSKDQFPSTYLELPLKLMLVVDASQSMATAADCLQYVLQHLPQAKGSSSSSVVPPLLVVATHPDVPKAKNVRRLKLQLQKEWDRLQSESKDGDNDDDDFWSHVEFCSVPLVAGGDALDGLEVIQSFVMGGGESNN